MLAFEHGAGSTLAEQAAWATDEELGRVWDMVIRLHEHHVAHRGLTADRILFTPDSRVMLLDPGDGDVAASDLQRRLDLAQLIVELALYVGPEKSVELALDKVGGTELTAVLPLLQPVALVRSTRHALRRRRDVLPGRPQGRCSRPCPSEEVAPVRLERIRAAHPGDAGGQRRRGLPAGGRAGHRPASGSLLQVGGLALGPGRAGAVRLDLRGRLAVGVRVRRPSGWASSAPCWSSWPARSSRW